MPRAPSEKGFRAFLRADPRSAAFKGRIWQRPRKSIEVAFANTNHNRAQLKPNMILRIFVAIAALLSPCIAHNIQLKAHSRECFHEFLHADDKMTVTFQVGDREFGGSGNLEIDFWVRSCFHLTCLQ